MVEIMIANMHDHRGNGNDGAGKVDGPSDDVMDLLHARDVLCPMELEMNVVLLLLGIVNLSPFARIHDVEGPHWQGVSVGQMRTTHHSHFPCPSFYSPPPHAT